MGLDSSCISHDTWKPAHLFSLCVFVRICLACLPAVITVQFSVTHPMVMAAATKRLLFSYYAGVAHDLCHDLILQNMPVLQSCSMLLMALVFATFSCR